MNSYDEIFFNNRLLKGTEYWFIAQGSGMHGQRCMASGAGTPGPTLFRTGSPGTLDPTLLSIAEAWPGHGLVMNHE